MSEKVKRLIGHKAKGFCSNINVSFDFCRKASDVNFETKFAQIRHELIKIHRFKK